MKKNLLITIFCLNFISTIYAQFEYKPDSTKVFCKEQFKKAEKEFNNNTFILRIQKTPHNTETHRQVVEKYGVKLEILKLYIENCYDYKVKQLLNKKFNFNFVEHTEKEAKLLDKKGLGYRKATLRIKEINLKSYILNNLSKRKLKKLKKKYKEENIWISLIVDKKGYSLIKSIGLLSDINVNSFNKTENNINQINEPSITNLIDNKLLFNPEIKKGIPVTSGKFMIRIDFRE